MTYGRAGGHDLAEYVEVNTCMFKRFIKKTPVLYKILYPLIFLRNLLINRKIKIMEKHYDYIFSAIEQNRFVVNVPEFRGSFEIDSRSDIFKRILILKHYEFDNIKVVEKYTDQQKDVIDVGANIGLFTNLFSKIISDNNKVLAIEPTPMAIEHLRSNMERNKIGNRVILFEGVATDKAGKCDIKTIPGMEEYSSLGNIIHQAVKNKDFKSVEVTGETIDNLVERFNLKPGFIKIDTEGAEYLVLKGAINTLRVHKPIILSELSDHMLSGLGYSVKECVGFLEKIGYTVIDADLLCAPRTPFEGEILAIPAPASSNND